MAAGTRRGTAATAEHTGPGTACQQSTPRLYDAAHKGGCTRCARKLCLVLQSPGGYLAALPDPLGLEDDLVDRLVINQQRRPTQQVYTRRTASSPRLTQEPSLVASELTGVNLGLTARKISLLLLGLGLRTSLHKRHRAGRDGTDRGNRSADRSYSSNLKAHRGTSRTFAQKIRQR
jgi:hypothetical protein